MFMVMMTEAVPDHLRGYLRRFLTEATVGAFVGNVSPVVADNLWSRAEKARKNGRLVGVFSDRTSEQGYRVKTSGDSSRRVIEIEGLQYAAMFAQAGENTSPIQ